jgi:hypothetical protein
MRGRPDATALYTRLGTAGIPPPAALAPLLLLLGMLAGALAPGLIAGDRPFQTSLCGLEQAPAACAPLERSLSAVLHDGGGELVQPSKGTTTDRARGSG